MQCKSISTSSVYFVEAESRLPIAGLDRPAPCPFCGDGRSVNVELDRSQFDSLGLIAIAVCYRCGTQGPNACTEDLPENAAREEYDVTRLAAQRWNKRAAEAEAA